MVCDRRTSWLFLKSQNCGNSGNVVLCQLPMNIVIAVPYLTVLISVVLLSETCTSAVYDSASRENCRKVFVRFLYAQSPVLLMQKS